MNLSPQSRFGIEYKIRVASRTNVNLQSIWSAQNANFALGYLPILQTSIQIFIHIERKGRPSKKENKFLDHEQNGWR